MISAELSHNPYTLKTTARFNGREPKINSAIERFDEKPLVEWVNMVPRIFHDEMNGYDFDFLFSGTDADYEKVAMAFSCQGVFVIEKLSDSVDVPSDKRDSRGSIRLVRKGHLEDVNAKRQEVCDLLSWLDSHRNRWFEYDEFAARNSEVLDGTIPFLIVTENTVQLDLPFVSVETVDSARDSFEGVDLTDTPVVLTVNPRNRAQFRRELEYVLNRQDIKPRQLFFYIHPSMNRERVIRVIVDLGVNNPQIVEGPESAAIRQYLDDYPSMVYIRNVREILRSQVEEVRDILKQVGESTEEESADYRAEAAALDSKIEGYKGARAIIHESSAIPGRWGISAHCQQFTEQILTWRNRKTGATGTDQIERAANDFARDVWEWVLVLEGNLIMAMHSMLREVDNSLSRTYSGTGTAPDFTPDVKQPDLNVSIEHPDIVAALVSQTGTERVIQKNDFFGLFGAAGTQGGEAASVEVASFDVWRYTVRGMMMPVVQQAIEASEKELSDYHASLVEAYSQQLDELIEDALDEKELLTSMLSETGRLFEEDREWLSEFEDRLLAIERN